MIGAIQEAGELSLKVLRTPTKPNRKPHYPYILKTNIKPLLMSLMLNQYKFNLMYCILYHYIFKRIPISYIYKA